MSTLPGNHPRLYFSRDELTDLRARAQQGVRKEALDRIVNWCERLLDPSDPDHFDYEDYHKPHWQQRKSIFILRPALLSLSFAHAFTGDKRYGEAARDAVLNLIERKLSDVSSVSYGVQTPGWRHSIGHDKSIYAWSICTVYDLCYDLFDENQRQIFIAHALESIEVIPYDSPVFIGDMGQMTNNRGARGQIGPFGYYPLTLEGDVEVPRIEEHIGQARAAMEAFLHTSFDPDGVSFDGPSYAQVLEQLYLFCRMLARSGRINLLKSRRWEQYMHHLVHEMLPGGYTLNDLNDCFTPCGTAVPALHLMGTERGAILPWLMRQLDLHPQRIEHVQTDIESAMTGANSICILLNWQDDAPVSTPQELGYPISRLFPNRGIASMRSGWDDDDYLVSLRCGREGWRLHKQSDQNHLALYALGERFLVDEGYGQATVSGLADNTKLPFRYFGCADVHNTVLFDGRDQNGTIVTPGWAEGRLVDWESTSNYDTSLGDATEAYGVDHAIESALRRVVFVRNTPHPFIVVIDTMCVAEDHEQHDYMALWRTAKENAIEVDGNGFRIVGQKNDCYGEVLSPGEIEMETIVQYNLPQLRVKTRAARLEMVTVLTPISRGEAPPAFTCRRTAENEFLVSVRDGTVLHTIRAGTRTTGPLHTPVPVVHEVR